MKKGKQATCRVVQQACCLGLLLCAGSPMTPSQPLPLAVTRPRTTDAIIVPPSTVRPLMAEPELFTRFMSWDRWQAGETAWSGPAKPPTAKGEGTLSVSRWSGVDGSHPVCCAVYLDLRRPATRSSSPTKGWPALSPTLESHLQRAGLRR